MSGSLLLDTCAVIWIANGAPIADASVAAMDAAYDRGASVYVSPISAWEIGLLTAAGRFKSTMAPQRWFQRLLETPGLRLAELTPDILIASSFLPGELRRDPADRILAATAREYGFVLMTRDRALLDYAAEGHVQALAC